MRETSSPTALPRQWAIPPETRGGIDYVAAAGQDGAGRWSLHGSRVELGVRKGDWHSRKHGWAAGKPVSTGCATESGHELIDRPCFVIE